MDPFHQAIINEAAVQLCSSIDLTTCGDILHVLFQHHVINESMKERILSHETHYQKVSCLLETLKRRGPNAFPVFMEALKTDYRFLYDLLQGKLESDKKCVSRNSYQQLSSIQKTLKGVTCKLPEASSDDYLFVVPEEIYDPNGYVSHSSIGGTVGKGDTYYSESKYITLVMRKAFETKHIILDDSSDDGSDILVYDDVDVPDYGINNIHNTSEIRSSTESLIYAPSDKSLEEINNLEQTLVLKKGDIVFAHEIDWIKKKDPIQVTDKTGLKVIVPRKHIGQYGDPKDEIWFYPLTISSTQASLLLASEKSQGIFLVYKSPNANTAVPYRLSVRNHHGEVVTYHITQNQEKKVGLGPEADHWFSTVEHLIRYYQKNRGPLISRLRSSLKEVAQSNRKLQPGVSYPSDFDIPSEEITFDGTTVGIGCFGEVKSATYAQQKVAVKFMMSGVQNHDMEAFLEEANMLVNLDHPNIIRLIGISSNKRPCILISYEPEGTLLECIKKKHLEVSNIPHMASIISQIMAALVYLKEKRFIIHRDVATRNILVSNGQSTVKLSDFGMARHVLDDCYMGEENEKVPVCWSSPEILREMQFSTKSDMWSAGVMMWELWSDGVHPLQKLTKSEVTIHICQGKRVLLEKPSTCPDKMYALMKECWHINPESRPTAEEVYENLSILQHYGLDGVAVYTEMNSTHIEINKSKTKTKKRWRFRSAKDK